jgi:hypothetical protein
VADAQPGQPCVATKPILTNGGVQISTSCTERAAGSLENFKHKQNQGGKKGNNGKRHQIKKRVIKLSTDGLQLTFFPYCVFPDFRQVVSKLMRPINFTGCAHYFFVAAVLVVTDWNGIRGLATFILFKNFL